MSPIEVEPEIRATVRVWAETEPRLLDFQEMLARRGEMEPARAKALVEELLTALLDDAEQRYISELSSEISDIASIRSELQTKYRALLDFFEQKKTAMPTELPAELQPGAFETLFKRLEDRLDAIRRSTVEGVVDTVGGPDYQADVDDAFGEAAKTPATSGPGGGGPPGPRNYKAMSLPELRALARSDSEAAWELIGRLKAMKRPDLLEQARAGDPYAQQLLGERPSRWLREPNEPELVAELRDELRAARVALGHEQGTIGVAMTDLPLPVQEFEGYSPLASEHEQPSGEIKPPPTQTHTSAQGHAEEVLANQIWNAVEASGIDPKTVQGTVVMHIEMEVCSVCRQGLDSRAPLGVLGQISERLPNVVFEVTAEGVGEVIRIENGRRIY